MRLKSIAMLVGIAPWLIAASEPVHLQPSSPWVVDYATNSCRLIRMFGEGDNQAKLVLESVGRGDMSMLVTGAPVPVASSSAMEARFLPLQSKPVQGISAAADGGKNGAVWSHVELSDTVDLKDKSSAEQAELKEVMKRAKAGLRPLPVEPAKAQAAKAKRQAFAQAVTGVELRSRFGQPLVLETGSLGEPLASFDACVRDLIRSWGLNPDVEDQISKPAWARRPQSWFSTEDYPPQMLAQGAESIISARLLIDATGKITNCTSLSHFNAPQFDQKVCSIFMTRGHYEPAELPDGTKVPSYVVQTIVFV